MKKKFKLKKIVIVIALLVFFLAFILIGTGVYFNSISQPKYIMGHNINQIYNAFFSYFNVGDTYFVGDTYNLNSDIDFELNSEYYAKRTDEESIKRNKFINNLNKMDTHLTIEKSEKKQDAYVELLSTIGNENIIHSKNYVHNATKYYFIESVLNQYINDGTCNYFESLVDDKTSLENKLYLREVFIKYFTQELSNEFVKQYKVSHNIGGKEKEVLQNSFKITDKVLHTIINRVLKDLKEDNKANSILSNIFYDFATYKLKDNQRIIDKDESYTFNIYTTTFLYKPLKYELVHVHADDEEIISYEGDNVSGDVFYIENNKMIYQCTMHFEENKVLMEIMDSNSKKLGEFKFEKDDNNFDFDYSFDSGNKKYDFVFSSKFSNYKRGVGYENSQNLSFKIIIDKKSRLSGTIGIDTKVNNKVSIDEDISSAVLSSKLSDEQKQKIKNYGNSIIERLER